jgi:hypothetical protein
MSQRIRFPVMVEQQRVTYVLLDEDDDRSVVVRPRDNDKFMVTSKEAVAACFAYDKFVSGTNKQVAELMGRLSLWVKDHRQYIKSAFVTFRMGNSMLFLVMQKEPLFDPMLSEHLTDLDIEIANDASFDLIDLDVMAIPPVSRESAEAFLSCGQVFTHAE